MCLCLPAWFKLLLLFWVFIYSEPVPLHVMGKKGGSIILPCELKTRDIFHIRLNRESKNILVYQKKYCSKGVCKKGACDVVINDLSFSDAGKYILDIYYINAESMLGPQIRTYQLHIYDDIFVKIGERLKLDVLLPDAHQVTHQNKSSSEWKKVWQRDCDKRVNITHGRLSFTDGTLSIKEFTADDAGTYRVLGSDGEILITVTVTDENKSKGKLNNTPDDKKRNHWGVLGPAGLFVSAVFALLFLILIAAGIKKMQ
ncbi:uncharacterized protein LOC132144949 isoform X1 [Carassius carassius]|uniref:uncharacterized protein LOC132144949 isoform X1 n=1 Tax=Carassius carassius TaxID=217509 RepID=UPI0028687872|nr:uncharacterized protein LOC132144949 isoform X1 [Carassius carassius]